MLVRNMAIKYCEFLNRKGKAFNIVVGVFCALFLGAMDYYSDLYIESDYPLSFFYLLPVAFVAWFAGRNAAIALAIACVAIKISIQASFPEALSLLIWKNGSAFAFFLIVGLLLAKLRQLLENERALSRIDHLTGAVNRKVFLDVATNEIYRLRRNDQPFTLAYIDIDNFKEINDTRGHSTGDFLLQTVVATISENLRRTDVVSRLGGDEFAILLINSDEQAALVAIYKIREQLRLGMIQHNLAVTFSIGVLTCTVTPNTVDEIVTLSDNLMYEVKKSGKNGIRHAVYARCAAKLEMTG